MYSNFENEGKEIINRIKIFIYRIQIKKINKNAYIQEIISTIFDNEDLIIKSEIVFELILPKNKLYDYFQ